MDRRKFNMHAVWNEDDPDENKNKNGQTRETQIKVYNRPQNRQGSQANPRSRNKNAPLHSKVQTNRQPCKEASQPNNSRRKNNGRKESKFPSQTNEQRNRTEPKGEVSERIRQPMGYKRLQELVNKDPNEVLLTFLDKDSGLNLIFEQALIKRDLMAYFVTALGRAVSSNLSNNVKSILTTISSKQNFFFVHIPQYLATFFQNCRNERYHLNSIDSLCDFLLKFQNSLQSTASEILIILLPLLDRICQSVFSENDEMRPGVLGKLKKLEEDNKYFLKDYTPVEIKQMSAKEKLQLQEPPENFRTIPVMPTSDDIHTSHSFLRPNLVRGEYSDTEHYLDVQYRLLREDYVRPLRDGVSDYLSQVKRNKQVKNLKDARLYTDMHIIKQDFVKGGLVHIALFDVKKFSKIKWEFSKRFLSGSLLCLSDDNFETMLFASVAVREPKELSNGKLVLRFEELTDEVLNISPLRSFVVIETTAYFEAYRHNLSALLGLDEDRLPLKSYIVSVQKDVGKPKYLKETTTYDMRPLLLPLNGNYITHLSDVHGNTKTSYQFPTSVSSQAASIPALKEDRWPSHTELNLDPSQYEAIKAAITKEFTVIQGPPGTGKTFVGLRIAQLLLHNWSKWQPEKESSPILVVCYTNHALDQFLEGLLQFTRNIVRVGGRGSNEALSQYQLNTLKRGIEDKRQVPNYIFRSIKQKNYELKRLKEDIDYVKSEVDKSYSSVLDEYQLQNNIGEKHKTSLLQMKRSLPGDDCVMHYWLGVKVGFNEVAEEAEPQAEKLTNVVEMLNNLHVTGITAANAGQAFAVTERLTEAHVVNMLNDIYAGDITGITATNVNPLFPVTERLTEADVVEMLNNIYAGDITGIHAANADLTVALTDKLREYHVVEMLNTFYVDVYSDISATNVDPDVVLTEMLFGAHVVELLTNLYAAVITEITAAAEVGEEADSEGEADIEYIENQRALNVDEFADVSYDVPQLRREFEIAVEEEDDGWKVQGGRKRRQKFIRQCLNNSKALSEEEANRIMNVWELDIFNRWRLYKLWLEKFVEGKMASIFELQQQLRKEFEELVEMRSEEDLFVCRRAQVVGMTTTGAAKYRNIVQDLNPKIVIVEEAAEILESHIVTSLAPGTEHLILIGDHQQLRPSPTVHALAVKYDLNVSLFERMLNNGMECYRLGIQHRMRPEIASLLVPHIYKELRNHESVFKFETIRGISKNMYFINHDISEQQEFDSKSKVNQHEAKFIVSLCRYILLQGYEPSQITVLTTYSGQLFAFKNLKGKGLLQGVKFTVVDNYQGEENDIILISFVRSNVEGNIGFLKISNRVCVALSRAKKGLYCIGNFELLAEKSDLWKNIVNTLNINRAIGPSLQLTCQNHPEVSSVVACDKDFESVPEGGCTRNCEFRLSCGHVCSLVCHPYDREHENIRCQKQCSKKCLYGHECKRKCYQKCGSCMELVDQKMPNCGHTIKVQCYKQNEVQVCTHPCEKLLKCGHACYNSCAAPCILRCLTLVPVKSPKCGHTVRIQCCDSEDEEKLIEKCRNPCSAELSCGHMCKGDCRRCYQGRLHIACNQPCKRVLVCGHECKSPCSKSCPPCKNKCENRCVHSVCPKLCGEPCDICIEPCKWSCEHKKCLKQCGDICNRTPCRYPCKEKLKCNHPCIGFCGEPCPELCRICDKDQVEEIFFGSEDERNARFVCLEDCGHCFEVDGLTHWMEVEDKEKRQIQMKSCPRCKTVIRKNLRFGNVVKSCLQEIEKVKKITFGDKESNMALQKRLCNKIRTFITFTDSDKSPLEPILKVLSSPKCRSKQEITTMENVINIYELLLESTDSTINNSFIGLEESDLRNMLNNLTSFMKITKNWIIGFIKDEYLTASDQQLQEVTWEVHRLKLADRLRSILQERTTLHKNETAIPYVSSLMKSIVSSALFREADVKKCTELFQNLSRLLGQAIINVSDLEKKNILKAMGLSAGHWYQCPNGHVYCITECGGATQESRCNECGERIGGTQHRLISTNRVATAMDGARHSAWSDAMNMLNYELQ